MATHVIIVKILTEFVSGIHISFINIIFNQPGTFFGWFEDFCKNTQKW